MMVLGHLCFEKPAEKKQRMEGRREDGKEGRREGRQAGRQASFLGRRKVVSGMLQHLCQHLSKSPRVHYEAH